MQFVEYQSAAVLVALHTPSRLGLVPDAQLVAILGTAEEKSRNGMVRYAKTSTKPEHFVSSDASYPVVIAESGFVAWKQALPLESPRPVDAGDRPRIERAQGGQFLTQAPGDATMTVLPGRGERAITLAHRLEPLGQAFAKTLGAGFESTCAPPGHGSSCGRAAAPSLLGGRARGQRAVAPRSGGHRARED